MFTKKHLILTACLLFTIQHSFLQAKKIHSKKPRLTVVFIVDQFAYHYIPKLKDHFRYGLKELLSHGVVYTNAYHPHGIPETTTGHHGISTGTLPKYHGAILNQWYNKEYTKVRYVLDNSPNAACLENTEDSCRGKSGHNTMVDGLSDQFVLASTEQQRNHSYSIALKAHPAIATANRLGKAIWFDSVKGVFTSSKKYFDQLPSWVDKFNTSYGIPQKTHITWKSMYDIKSSAYDFPEAQNYDFAGLNFSIVSRKSVPVNRSDKEPYDLFTKTPDSGKAIIELSKICVNEILKNDSHSLLIWVCLSALDLVGHFYGPDSIECIDMIYHVDKHIKEFMDYSRNLVGDDCCLFVVTGDHGIPPIPEIAQKRGMTLARRIMAKPLIEKINKMIEEKYEISDIIKAFEPTFFILNKEVLAQCTPEQRQSITHDIKKCLTQQPGIKKAWTAKELYNLTFEPHELESFYKTQLYKNRSGDIICMPDPYCLITHYPSGTSHSTPYDYDTHVPLIIYQKNHILNETFDSKVWIPQLPVTLAHILGIARPSASTYNLLPGFDA